MLKITSFHWSVMAAICLISSCDAPPIHKPKTDKQQIASRQHRPMYQVNVPEGWKREDPIKDISLDDTMLPIATYYFDDIKLTIHTFPNKTMEGRIHPQAQVNRWTKQLSKVDEENIKIKPVGHSGFLGLQFEAEGEIDQQPLKVLAWTMQIAPEHYYVLSAKYPEDDQIKADWTIKVVGPKEAVDKQYNSILSFAESFELIEEIP